MHPSTSEPDNKAQIAKTILGLFSFTPFMKTMFSTCRKRKKLNIKRY